MSKLSERKQQADAKKRSQLKTQSKLTPPKDFDNVKYAGRWVAQSRLQERSDGYEPRGFETWKNTDGETVRVGDLVWCQMSKDEASQRKQATEEEARDQIDSMRQDLAEQDERLNHELRKYSGKSTTDIKIN